MRVQVLFFGMLRDIVGMSREEAEFPGGADLHSVFAGYAARFPRLGDLARSIVVARNQEFADPATRLAEGDEVAFLPPVSGGCDTGDLEIARSRTLLRSVRHPSTPATVMRASSPRRGRRGDLRRHVRQSHPGGGHPVPGYECYESMA